MSVMMAFLPIVLDVTILHVAVPSLTLALQATGNEVLWIIDVYPLLMASLLIPMGTLADRVGHRRMLLIGLAIFCTGSILAALAPSAAALIGARAFMAAGAAMVMPCTLAIVRQTFADEGERAIALGTWGAVASAGAAIGPLAGGALLEHFWWGAVFLVNVPVMLVVVPLVVVYIPRRAVVAGGSWTIGQAVMLILGIMASVYALKSAFKTDGSFVVTIACFSFGLLMLFWFVRKQLRAPDPMLDLSLFAIPAISAGVTMAIVVMGALAGVELMLAQELQFVLGRTPLEAGIFMLPLMVASAIGGPLSGMILGAVGLRWVASCSLLVSAASLIGLALTGLDNGGVSVVLMLAALGLSLSVGLTASSVAIMSSTPVEKAGSAGALEATSYDLGSGLGITAFGILLVSTYERSIRLPDDIPAAMAEGATRSIGETMISARALGGEQEQQLIAAGQAAFSTSHSMVLLCAAALMGVLSLAIMFVLRRHDSAPAERYTVG
ncbi:MFS transporter [Pseudomonas sp. DSP3-2-2]|uniref:MFS transporter n=1 Tax=unclassified Pseudomonas TaxID=196821 RepID=UPI003CF02D83